MQYVKQLDIEQYEPHWNRGELRFSGRVNSSYSTTDTRRVTA
jgi:hypothetical protein